MAEVGCGDCRRAIEEYLEQLAWWQMDSVVQRGGMIAGLA